MAPSSDLQSHQCQVELLDKYLVVIIGSKYCLSRIFVSEATYKININVSIFNALRNKCVFFSIEK